MDGLLQSPRCAEIAAHDNFTPGYAGGRNFAKEEEITSFQPHQAD